MATTDKKTLMNEADLKKYFSSRRALIVSTQTAAARAVRTFILQMGAKPDLVAMSPDFAEAKKNLITNPTHFLVTDLLLGSDAGLELIDIQESKFENRLDVASMIMCSDPSSSVSGMIASSNVDAVLIKPFNLNGLKTAISQALENKVNPSPYWTKLEQGKMHLAREEYDQASQFFSEVTGLHAEPTLAYFYLGLTHQKKSNLDDAIRFFQQGLSINSQDFRCMSGLFDLYLGSTRYQEAYAMGIEIHKHYPVSAARITDIVKLSVYTKNYEDMQDYCQVFKQLDKKDQLLSRAVIAGLLIRSRYFSLKGNREKSIDALQNAAKIAIESQMLQLEVLRYFVESGYFDEGDQYFAMLAPEVKAQAQEVPAYAELLYGTQRWSELVHVTAALINKNVRSIRIFQLRIEVSQKLGLVGRSLEVLIEEAHSYFPDAFKKS